MIRFTLKPAPSNFEETTGRPGREWLANQTLPLPKGKRPTDFWTIHCSYLRGCFDHLCGYTMMFTSDGTVDHYWSCNKHLNRAYDWDNYRFVAGRINSGKQDKDDLLLDPFEIDDDWLEIDITTFRVVIKLEQVPEPQRARAENTYVKFKAVKDPNFINQRISWYERFLNRTCTLGQLREAVPLLARAIEVRIRDIVQREDIQSNIWLQSFWKGHLALKGLEDQAPEIASVIRAALPVLPPQVVQNIQRRTRPAKK